MGIREQLPHISANVALLGVIVVANGCAANPVKQGFRTENCAAPGLHVLVENSKAKASAGACAFAAEVQEKFTASSTVKVGDLRVYREDMPFCVDRPVIANVGKYTYLGYVTPHDNRPEVTVYENNGPIPLDMPTRDTKLQQDTATKEYIGDWQEANMHYYRIPVARYVDINTCKQQAPTRPPN